MDGPVFHNARSNYSVFSNSQNGYDDFLQSSTHGARSSPTHIWGDRGNPDGDLFGNLRLEPINEADANGEDANDTIVEDHRYQTFTRQ